MTKPYKLEEKIMNCWSYVKTDKTISYEGS